MKSRALTLAVLAGVLLVAHHGDAGPIYRFVDEAGVVVFTDNPWQFDVYRRHLNEESERTSAAPPNEPAAWPRDEVARSPRIVSIAQEIIHLAGMNEQIQILNAIAQSEMDQLSWRYRWSGPVRARLSKTFAPETLHQGMSRSLSRRLDPVRTAALLTWLRSPLSRRIVAMEGASTNAARAVAMTQFINQLPSTPIPPTRLALVHRIARASQAVESTAVVLAATGAAIQRALPVQPVPTRAGGELEEPDLTVDEMLRFRTMTALMFTYKDLRDDELGRYATFLESPLGRWFTNVSREALLDSLLPPRDQKPGALIRSAQR